MRAAREGIMPLVENRTKLKLKNNELALGFGVHHLRTAATAMLAAAADHDCLFIDMEHGAHSVHEATQLCIAALPTGVTPIVRICAGALDEGTRCLDNGALGVIVPHVDTAERAKEIARAFRYPPLGTRSWGGPPAAFGYRAPGNAEAQAALNKTILVVAMIESPQAVANAKEIAAVEGIDALLIGTSDLTAEMGISPDRSSARRRSLRERRRRLPRQRQGARHGRHLRQGGREPLHQGRCAAHPVGIGSHLSARRREGARGGPAG